MKAKEFIEQVKHGKHDQSSHGRRGGASGSGAPSGLPRAFTMAGVRYVRPSGKPSDQATYSSVAGKMVLDKKGKIIGGQRPFAGKSHPKNYRKLPMPSLKYEGKWYALDKKGVPSRDGKKKYNIYSDTDDSGTRLLVDQNGDVTYD